MADEDWLLISNLVRIIDDTNAEHIKSQTCAEERIFQFPFSPSVNDITDSRKQCIQPAGRQEAALAVAGKHMKKSAH